MLRLSSTSFPLQNWLAKGTTMPMWQSACKAAAEGKQRQFLWWHRDCVNKTCNDKMRSCARSPSAPLCSPGSAGIAAQTGREAVPEPEQTSCWGMAGNHLLQANLSTVVQLSVCIRLPNGSSGSCVSKSSSTAQVCPPCLSLQDNAGDRWCHFIKCKGT